MFADTGNTKFDFNEYPGDSDQDYADAWQELNDFLSSPGSTAYESTRSEKENRNIPNPPEMLRTDYENLNVPFGADFSLVRQSYRKLINLHHPDRNSGESDSLHKATEKSKDLNISFQKIKAWEIAKTP